MNKALKIILIVLVIIVAIPLITALFVKKEYKVERTVNIDQPKQLVFDYVKYLKNQNEYSVWSKIDPNMKTEFRGTDGTVGFVSAWDSSPVKEAGKGEQEIIKIADGERIDYELRFLEPMTATENAYMELMSNNETSTTVKWGFFGKIKYPMNVMLLFMDMDAMIGKDLEGGLSNLKARLEN